LVTSPILNPLNVLFDICPASFVHIMSPLLRTLTQLWKDVMLSSTQSGPLMRSTNDDIDDNVDISALIDITKCFTSLIMLTKNSSSHDLDRDSVGVGFDRRVVLFAALKEGRIFMEQFIKTTKVKTIEFIYV
jgi:hypothetical protein